MTRLIDALLSLSRVEMNAHVPPSGLVDLNDVLGHVRDTLEPLARESGGKLVVGRFPRPAIVRADRDELVQVFQNLVQNALRYGAKGAQIRLEPKQTQPIGRQPGRYAISVIDRDQGSRLSICRGSLSASTASTSPRAARRAALASGSPSSSTSSTAIAASSPSPPSPARALSSPCCSTLPARRCRCAPQPPNKAVRSASPPLSATVIELSRD